MKIAIGAAALFVMVAAQADAQTLKNCNEMTSTAQLEQRLRCLQENNEMLLKQVAELKGIINTGLKSGDWIFVRTSPRPPSQEPHCLSDDNGNPRFGRCDSVQAYQIVKRP